MVFAFWLLSPATFLGPPTSLSHLRVEGLRCEYRVNPLGIDTEMPRLSWILRSELQGQTQTAYRVLVASSPDRVSPGKADLWDSGLNSGPCPFNVQYEGKRLESEEKAYWSVMVTGMDGRPSRWSPIARWQMGLLNRADWGAKWISDGKSSPTQDQDFYRDDPAPLFRKEFRVDRPVVQASLAITGLGYFESYLNGDKVGDHVLDPGWTNYAKRVSYSIFDVTKQLHRGTNCIGVMLGNGWYNPLPMRLFGTFNLREQLDIGRPKFITKLTLHFADGTHQTVDSDSDWRVGTGPIQFNNVYLGEVVDARKAQPGWSHAGFDDRTWHVPAIATESIGVLQAQSSPPIRVTATIPAQSLAQPRPRTFIYDFGVEFGGWAKVRFNIGAGTKVRLRYGELLYPNGTLNPLTSAAGQIKTPYRDRHGKRQSSGGPGAPFTAWQSDTYIAKGGGPETFVPHFTFHGFRYLEITGLSEPPALDCVTGLRLNSDVPDAGSFSCSNDRFNDIQAMVRRTFLANLFSVQSDCPHRERLGYGGDIVGTSEAFMLNFDMSTFYEKTVRDFADAARPDGMLTDTAPFVGIQYCGVGWALAHPLVTDQLDRYYGNRRLEAEQYPVSKTWLGLVSTTMGSGPVPDGLSDHESLEPTPSPVMVTPLYALGTDILARMAKNLHQNDDMVSFQDLGVQIRDKYRDSFVNGETGQVGMGTQASQAFGLYANMVASATRDKSASFLLNKISEAGKGHLSTGLMGTKFMLQELSKSGHSDLAYKIVNQPDFPGWIWMLKNGATTLWEHWAIDDDTFSHCHPMFGSVSQWFINWLGGIQPAPDSVGFNHVLIHPQFDNDLTWVHSSHVCMYGRIVSNWRRVRDGIIVDLDIPVGVAADITLADPKGRSHSMTIPSGRYRFKNAELLK